MINAESANAIASSYDELTDIGDLIENRAYQGYFKAYTSIKLQSSIQKLIQLGYKVGNNGFDKYIISWEN